MPTSVVSPLLLLLWPRQLGNQTEEAVSVVPAVAVAVVVKVKRRKCGMEKSITIR
jgi:hypothetical protein